MRDTLIILSVFAVGWFVMMSVLLLVLSRVGGWSALAERYRANDIPPDGRSWRWRSVSMRLNTRYKGMITIRSTARGLYLAVPKLFSLGHPPLLIPWNEIEVTSERGLFFPYMCFRFTAVPNVF